MKRPRATKITRDRSCDSKAVFITKKLAKEFADKHGLRAYQCHFCRHWHMTAAKGHYLD